MSKHAVETTVLRRFEWTEARGGFSEEKLGFLHDASLLRKPTNHKIWHKIHPHVDLSKHVHPFSPMY